MIGDLKPYPEYKDSGLSWLGKIPADWEIMRMKFLLREIDSRSDDGSEQLLRVSQYTGVTPRISTDGNIDTRASSLIGYKRVLPYDLVINIMLAWNGSLGISRHEGIVSPAYCVYRFGNIAYPWFYHHLLRLPVYKGRIKAESTGVVESRLRLYSDDLGRIEMLYPPIQQQQKIANFVNAFDQKIERFIQAKRKLISLLNEQKQVIINKAVTRGLDPNVRFKSSGIPWLGDVPEHWEVRRFRTLVSKIEQGVSPLADVFLADNDSWGVLKAGCVNKGIFRDTEHKRLPKSFLIDQALAVRVGDVLISRASGSPKLVGSVGKVETLRYKLILSDKIFRPMFHDFVHIDFLVYAMNCRYFRQQVEQAISGAEGLANNLPMSCLKDFWLFIPPKKEAARISEQIRQEHKQFDVTIIRTEREIELIQEYRTKLVADVVTGQLDVSVAAYSLSEVDEEIGIPIDSEEFNEEEIGEFANME